MESLEKAAAQQLSKFVLWGWNREKFPRDKKLFSEIEANTAAPQRLAKYIRKVGAVPYVKISWLVDALAPEKKPRGESKKTKKLD